MDRKRPRLNVTLDADVKQKLEEKARAMSVSKSRLIEALIREFLELSREDPEVDIRVRRAIQEQKDARDGNQQSREQQIEDILDRLDG